MVRQQLLAYSEKPSFSVILRQASVPTTRGSRHRKDTAQLGPASLLSAVLCLTGRRAQKQYPMHRFTWSQFLLRQLKLNTEL